MADIQKPFRETGSCKISKPAERKRSGVNRVKYVFLTVVLLSAYPGIKTWCEDPPAEDILPKGVSITPMYPAVKFQKRDQQSYEFLSNLGASINFRPNDPGKNIWVFTSTGPIFSGIDSKERDWSFSWMVAGLTLVDKTSKMGVGVGLSCDLFGQKGDHGIGLIEDERAYFKNISKNIGFVITLNHFPSQTKTMSSKAWTEIAQKDQKPGEKSEYLLKAIALDPENKKAGESYIREATARKDPELAVEGAKVLIKAGAPGPAKVLLDSAKAQNPPPKLTAEIDILMKHIQ